MEAGASIKAIKAKRGDFFGKRKLMADGGMGATGRSESRRIKVIKVERGDFLGTGGERKTKGMGWRVAFGDRHLPRKTYGSRRLALFLDHLKNGSPLAWTCHQHLTR
jgi:hypothetical protein